MGADKLTSRLVQISMYARFMRPQLQDADRRFWIPACQLFSGWRRSIYRMRQHELNAGWGSYRTTLRFRYVDETKGLPESVNPCFDWRARRDGPSAFLSLPAPLSRTTLPTGRFSSENRLQDHGTLRAARLSENFRSGFTRDRPYSRLLHVATTSYVPDASRPV